MDYGLYQMGYQTALEHIDTLAARFPAIEPLRDRLWERLTDYKNDHPRDARDRYDWGYIDTLASACAELTDALGDIAR